MNSGTKILFGLLLSATFIACQKNENSVDEASEASDDLIKVAAQYIPKGFEHAQICKEVHLDGVTAPRGAVINSVKWPKGSVITVRLYGGTTKVRQKVEEYAKEWSNYANITFKFVTRGTAQIRVTFTPGGSYSYLGTAALRRPSDAETMNFGWFDDNTSDAEFSRTTIHEFGHALGMIHEHQNPVASIPWDSTAVYAYYKGAPNYWDTTKVNTNLFDKYSATQTQYSAYDPKSIMHYSVSSALTTNGFSVGYNNVLSDTDKAFIAQVYPQ